MKTVVIYKSNTGFTKKYAEWIAEELSADTFDIAGITADNLVPYDAVVYGGSLYATGITGIKFIKRNLDMLKDKKVVVFATGATPAGEETIREMRDRNFTPEQQKHIKFFYFRGGFNYDKLKPFDKFLATLMKWMLKRKKELTPDERVILAAIDNPVDFTDRKYIGEIVAYVNS
ncbi:MAG: flavodoxin domain-containing protein [Acetivibrionales bacterium]|jgi:menaquinone-dependent protoporphyrinogen IX oxidase